MSRLRLTSVVAIGSAFAGGLALWDAARSRAGGPFDAPTPTVSAVPPADVAIPAGLPGNPIDFFDDFSWRSFLAFNWPAVAGGRGTADATKAVGDLTAPRVWETWKADFETFQPGGIDPSPWASFDAITPCSDVPAADSGKVRILGNFSKFGDLNQAGFGLAASNPLVAQNATYVRYEIRTNQKEYEFITGKKWYLRANLPKPADPFQEFTTGSVEVKAAWKELKPTELTAAKARYYVVSAKVPDAGAGNKAVDRDFALVGLHIVTKTASRPQWIWSTFEHADAIPDPVAAVPAGAAFSFNDPTKPQVLAPAFAPPALSATNPPAASPTPMQVVRGRPIHPNTAAVNARYQAKLAGTVWANYRLAATEWPTVPVPSTGPGSPFPGPAGATCAANAVMETYFQKAGVSCTSCHEFARTGVLPEGRKTDFVWFVQVRAFPQMGEAGLAGLTRQLELLKAPENRDPARLNPAPKK